MQKPRIPKESKQRISKYVGIALFAAVPVNFTGSLFFAFHYSPQVPGLMMPSLILNLLYTSVMGVLGYLFWSGLLMNLAFQDKVEGDAGPAPAPAPDPIPEPTPMPASMPPMATPPPMNLPAMNTPMPGALPKNPIDSVPEENEFEEETQQGESGPFSGMGGAGTGGAGQG